MDKLYDVLHIGIVVGDIPVKVPYDVLDFTQDTIPLDSVQVLPGGDATNAAIVMSRLGKKAGLCAKIGNDHFGHAVVSLVENCGVDVRCVKVDPSTRTSVTIVLINARGERSFLYSKGNNDDFSLEDVDCAALANARHVNFGSLFAHPKLNRGGAEELFKTAKKFGATTSADVTFDSTGTGFVGIRGALRYVDYFLPSYGEAKYLSGETDPERMADFFIRETGDKTVVIKMGDEGCFVRSQGKSLFVRPYQVVPVDTTGAGDNFVAGFLMGLTSGWELEACADFACAVGALSVQHLGATSDAVNLNTVQAFMRRTPRR